MQAAHMWNEWAMVQGLFEEQQTQEQRQQMHRPQQYSTPQQHIYQSQHEQRHQRHGQQQLSNEQQQSLHTQQQFTRAQHQQTAHTVQQWRNPPPGLVKCNVDASFYDTVKATEWGLCARDHQGRFIIAGTNIMYTKLNTIEGEAMAIKEAMEEMIQR
ncbi:hypothetical protein L195_g058815, partial [Trifolium pratense]